MQKPPSEKTSAWIGRIFACIVGLLFVLPLVGYFIEPYSKVDVIEKRELADFPTYNGSPSTYIDQFNTYVNDHMGFRRSILDVHSVIEGQLANLGASEVRMGDVITGRDGWLFYISNSGLDDLGRKSYLSDDQLQTLHKLLLQRIDACHKSNIDYIFAVAPDKQSIYPEKLPWGVLNYGPPSRLEKITDYLDSDPLIKAHFVPLGPSLLKAKTPNALLYFKTDTHWNLRGSYVGYRAFMEKFKGLDNSLHVLNKDLNQFQDVPGTPGDIDTLGLPDISVVPPGDFSGKRYCSFMTNSKWSSSPQVGGTARPYAIYNAKALNPEVVVLCCDSFGEFIANFYLSQTFKRLVVCPIQPFSDNDLLNDVLNRVHPNKVLDMRIERYMNPVLQYIFSDSLLHPLKLNTAIPAVDSLISRLSDGSWQLGKDASGKPIIQQDDSNLVLASVNPTPAEGGVTQVSQAFDGADQMSVEGWARNKGTGRPFDVLLVTLGSQVIAVDRPNLEQTAAAEGDKKCAFKVYLTLRLLNQPGQIRFFGLTSASNGIGACQEIPVNMAPAHLTVGAFHVSANGGRLDVTQ